ncbi:PCMD domain-containing protein [Parabacteroides sp. ASD2025]|uniref:PCMD domain-containing protein n=1 Tax=Parabacteroides sp. ASD2025 TaxID=3415987 RepID=UPI003CF7C62C
MKGSIVIYFCLFVFLIFTGCIKNDYPLPTIEAEIKEIAIEGMQSVKFGDNAVVTVKVADTLDLSDLKVEKLVVTDQAKVIPDEQACLDFVHFPDTGFVSVDSLPVTANTRMNFKQPVSFLLRLYQDYEWKVNVSHEIVRKIKVKNQVGQALVDEVTKNVIIYVDEKEQPSFRNIEIQELQLGSSIAETTPAYQDVTDFTRPRVFLVSAFGETERWTVSVKYPNGDVQTTTISPWAKRAYLQGTTKTGNISVRYRLQKEEEADEWENVLSSEIEVNEEGEFTVLFTHLRSGETYEYELTVDGTTNEIVTFTTEAIQTVPNLSFDDWFKGGKNDSWFANKDLTDENYFWDSGNEGANSFADKNPTSPEEKDTRKNKAARLASTKVTSVFAAGSIYSGTFGKVEGLGAILNFGRPYTSRPSALKGYYKYTSGIIDVTKSPYDYLKGQRDSCHIYVALFTWNAPFQVNTTTQTFVDLSWNNPDMIAFGELKTDQSINDYAQFTIPLKYRDLTTKPTYILIVGAASKYGDYFTGSTSSVLLLDEFELVFE